MSALDFGGGSATNTTRFYSTSNSQSIDTTTGVALCAWIRHLTFTGDEVLVGAGVSGAASSIQLRTFGGGQYGGQIRDGVGANVTVGANYPAAGDYLLCLQYSTALASLQFFMIPKGGTVSGPSDTAVAAFINITPASPWYIGADGTDFTKTPLGEISLVNRVLTNAELTSLAAGAAITTVLTPQLYWPFRTGANATEANAGSVGSGANATRNGTGYTTSADFFGGGGGGIVANNERLGIKLGIGI